MNRGDRALSDHGNRSATRHAEKRRRDFGIIGRAQQTAAAEFVSRLPLRSGHRLLDAACGTGIASIPAARAGADVTGVDPREPFLSRGRAWAKNESLLIRFKPAELVRLPFSDGNFHVVLNFMGLPFAPDPPGAAREMLRVCRRRGLLAVTAWTPSGLMGTMLHLAYQYTGDDRLKRARELCEPEALLDLLEGARARDGAASREAVLELPLAPAEIAACFLDFHAPLQQAAAGLEREAREALAGELAALWEEVADTDDGTTRARAQYSELVLTRS